MNKSSSVYGLNFKRDDINRNRWFVLRLDFGSILFSPSQMEDPNDVEWIQRAKCLGNETKRAVFLARISLLPSHKTQSSMRSLFGKHTPDQVTRPSVTAGMDGLKTAITGLGGRILVLVDEYE